MTAAGATASADEGVAAAVATAACTTLVARVDATPGTGPVLLRSYDGAGGQGLNDVPALRGAAFTYDNALAAIALFACDRPAHALRIVDALQAAAAHDRSGRPGRLRNTYRAGPITERPVPPMGWWDAGSNRWLEDAYQVGSATGNVAWAALALLTAAQATDDRRYRDAAANAARWIVANARDERGAGGFTGGVHGYDDAPQSIGWKSTEHNIDVAAVFEWLARTRAPSDPPDAPAGRGASAHAAHARVFVDAMWDDRDGRFLIGTLPDGESPNRGPSALDAQLWPLLLCDPRPQWRRALDHAQRVHGVRGGFDFDGDRDGLWVEGTAQAALTMRVVGRSVDASALLAEIATQRSPGGYFWATREPRITTGLAIGPASTTDDFRYYRLPHLGTTAWAALAAIGWNPFSAPGCASRR